jgi:hypothetical protein
MQDVRSHMRAPCLILALEFVIARLLLASLLATVSAPSLATSNNLLLGMLEEVPGVYAGENNSRKVRVLFARQGLGWIAYKSACDMPKCLAAVVSEYPREVTWFIGLDGRQIGQVVARTPTDFRFYAHIGLQDIVDGKAPLVGKPSYEYGGFGGRELHRPLVAVSQPYFKDPALWKRAKVTSEVRKQGLALLQNHAPKVCREGPTDAEPLVPYTYRSKDLRIRLHRSSSEWSVMTIDVERAYFCEGGAGGGLFDAQTFAVDRTGKVRFLGAGLMLLDAGDYDNDGRSELVFALSLYNRGGYVLFADDFTEQARFEFGYH